MEQATQVYFEYGSYIKALKTERNKKIKSAIKMNFVVVKNKVSTFSKRQIQKFKDSIKDLDQTFVNGYLAGKEKFLAVQTKVVEKTIKFKKDVAIKITSFKSKVAKFNKQQIYNAPLLYHTFYFFQVLN